MNFDDENIDDGAIPFMDKRFAPGETQLLQVPDELSAFLENEIATRGIEVPAESSGELLELRLKSEDLATMIFMLCRRANGCLLVQAPPAALRKPN